MSKPRKPKAQPGRDPRLRSAAEAQLARSPGSPGRALQPQARPTLATIHELQVHQIELEMQNDELKWARLALEESRDRYLDLYDFAPVGYFTFTREGRIIEVNLTGAALLGVPRARLIGRGLGSFLAAEDRDRWEHHLMSLPQSGASAQRSGEKQSCELKLKREDGSTFHARLESVGLDRPRGLESAGAGGERSVIHTALSDITERVEAQRALQEAHNQMLTVLESITDAFFSLDRQWRFTYVNHGAERIFGRPRETFLGHSIWEMFPPAVGSTFQREYERAVAENRTVHFEEFYPPFGRWFQVHAYPSTAGLSVYFNDITERRQAEATLRESAEFTRRVIESSSDCIKVLDLNGHLISMSEGGRKLLEIDDLAPYLNRSWVDFWKGQDREAALQALARARQGDAGSFCGLCETAKGVPKWWEVMVSPIKDAGGTINRLLAVSRDVTERKGMEEAQEFLSRCGYQGSSEDFFHALARYLAQSLGMDFVCIDQLLGDGLAAQTLAIYFDGKFEDNIAYALKDTPCGEVVGKTICCFPKDVRRLFAKDPVLQEMRAESYVGTTLWSLDGKPIGLIAVIGRKPLANPRLAESMLKLVAVRAAGELQRTQAEIALRRAHDELELRVKQRTAELLQTNENLRREIEVRRQTERELTEAQLSYRTVAEFTHDWEYWETPEYVLRYCSPSCERITGYSAREFLADPRLLQQIVHPDDAGLWRKHREESLAAPEPRVIQFRIRKKDGGVRWVEHAWQPVLGNDGLFLGIRASNRDITQRKESELQTQQLREELAHVSRVTTAGQLAASLAHELNQPLTAILCNAQTAGQFLATAPPNVAEVREVLDDIAHDSARAGGVIQRLRALFTKTAQERSVLQINEIIHETIDLLRSEFVLKGIATQVHLEPTLPRVLGNRIELQQVILNVVVNAMEAMGEREPGQRQLQIATGCDGPGEIRASIRDSGTGIRVQPISRLFEPFFTTKASGMGMGLAISRSILETHGGSLRASNNPDRGATFVLTLPIHHEEHP